MNYSNDALAFNYRQSEEAPGFNDREGSDNRNGGTGASPYVVGVYGQHPPSLGSISSDTSPERGPRQFISDATHTKIVQGLFIGIFAIFGALLRMLTAQFFGEECNNPGTVGWLASGSPLCVTGSRQAEEEGGIIFADLPANMLGSFVMGFFASCDTLKLAVSTMKIAWLRPNHPFQKMPILHKAITTGFCGSLTTFSGWNSSMVILLYGTGDNRSTHVINALFGYIIGMEVSIGCFVAGKSLARKIYRWVNPIMARESDAMLLRQQEGVYMNPELPDFERRFLPDLHMGKLRGEKDYGETVANLSLEYLAQWRTSTEQVRRVNHPLLPTLNTIERAILVDCTSVPLEAESIAHTHGWNVAALREWTRARDGDPERLPSITDSRYSLSPAIQMMLGPDVIFTIPFAASIFFLLMALLVGELLWITNVTSYSITNRTMVYAMLWAPFGALLRWELSSLNGTLTWEDWTWFPLGTFTANLVGSVMSITAIAMEYMMEPKHNSFWVMGSIRAIKVGFVGSLTTVSTFVAEVDGFITTHTDHAYPYMLTTLCTCCAAASLVYAVMVYPVYSLA
ncbi:hypothetical protein ACA910_016612 [Epithemia clementina (nom. ined.)]